MAGGIDIATLLRGVFDGFGYTLPAGGLVIKASCAMIAVAATVLAGVLPVLRTPRVSTRPKPGRVSRTCSVPGFLMTGAGAGAVMAGTAGSGQGLAVAGAAGTLAGFVIRPARRALRLNVLAAIATA